MFDRKLLLGPGLAIALAISPVAYAQSGQTGTSSDPASQQGTVGSSQSQSSTTGQESQSQGSMSGQGNLDWTDARYSKDEVRLVQEALKSRGIDPGPVDGVKGKKTKQALREFQKQNNLTVVGDINNDTLRALGVWDGPLSGSRATGQASTGTDQSGTQSSSSQSSSSTPGSETGTIDPSTGTTRSEDSTTTQPGTDSTTAPDTTTTQPDTSSTTTPDTTTTQPDTSTTTPDSTTTPPGSDSTTAPDTTTTPPDTSSTTTPESTTTQPDTSTTTPDSTTTPPGSDSTTAPTPTPDSSTSSSSTSSSTTQSDTTGQTGQDTSSQSSSSSQTQGSQSGMVGQPGSTAGSSSSTGDHSGVVSSATDVFRQVNQGNNIPANVMRDAKAIAIIPAGSGMAGMHGSSSTGAHSGMGTGSSSTGSQSTTGSDTSSMGSQSSTSGSQGSMGSQSGMGMSSSSGMGLIVRKNADGSWSRTPAFIRMSGGSTGLQSSTSGGDLVLVFNDENSINALMDGSLDLASEVTVQSGPSGAMGAIGSTGTTGSTSGATGSMGSTGTTGSTGSTGMTGSQDPSTSSTTGMASQSGRGVIYAYSRSAGSYSGTSITSGTITIDDSANQSAYGRQVSARDLLGSDSSSQVQASAVLQPFVDAISSQAPARAE